MSVRLSCMLSVLLSAGLLTPSLATSYAPKENNEVVALNLHTGEVVWKYQPDKLSDARFEVYDKGLVMYRDSWQNKKAGPTFLNPSDGKPIAPFDTSGSTLLAKSPAIDPPPEILLPNGWKLTGFLPRNSKSLQFADPQSGDIVWEIKTAGYPHRIGAWKDLVFYAFGTSKTDEGIYAYRQGESQPLWKVNLSLLLRRGSAPLPWIIFQVIDDTIYVESGVARTSNSHHLFAFEAPTGKLLWHRNLAWELGIAISAAWDHFQDRAIFAKSDNVLVVAFHRLVVALDLKTHKYLWRLDPDTLPHIPFPVIHDSKVFLSSGANRKLTKLKDGLPLPPPERIVHFPKDRSLGRLRARDWGKVDLDSDVGIEWDELGQAQGDVRVPAAKELWLQVSKEGASDLSPLATLRPDDLYMLGLWGRVTSDQLRHIEGLTGLRELYFHNPTDQTGIPQGTQITDDELILLGGLTSLWTLNLYFRFSSHKRG